MGVLVLKAMRLDEVTQGEDIPRRETSSKEWPSKISPAPTLHPLQEGAILLLEELAPFTWSWMADVLQV